MTVIKNVKSLWVQHNPPFKTMTVVTFLDGEAARGYLDDTEYDVSLS